MAQTFSKKNNSELDQFAKDTEIQSRIKAKQDQTEATSHKKSVQNRAVGIAKVVPKSRMDIYSPRRVFQQNPYKSYWMSCVERLLEAEHPFEV